MRILFGPEHDGSHIDPDTPGAYEWWYFDAISDDGRYALVAIWFHGSPMSPYYKAVVDGKNPLPRDWCGVFFSLHEKGNGRWRERAYAYNLYRLQDRPGEVKKQWFRDAPLRIKLGGSELEGRYTDRGRFIGHTWDLKLDEPGLWRGRARAELEFKTPGKPLKLPPMGDAEDESNHSWVCVAPICQVSGTVTLPNGKRIEFRGNGYHDHNFGQLPWNNLEIWYWARGVMRCTDGNLRAFVLYHLIPQEGAPQTVGFIAQPDEITFLPLDYDYACHSPGTWRTSYGWRHAFRFEFVADDPPRNTVFHPLFFISDFQNVLSHGPFYRRLIAAIWGGKATGHKDPSPDKPFERETDWEWYGEVEGIGEVFRPAHLCGPIVSRAMWTRIRRRS